MGWSVFRGGGRGRVHVSWRGRGGHGERELRDRTTFQAGVEEGSNHVLRAFAVLTAKFRGRFSGRA